MSKTVLPDKTKALVDEKGIPSIAYLTFFDNLARGDQGTEFTPTITNLTSVGTPTLSGRYFYVAGLVYFRVTITPATNTSSSAGSTYMTFPLTLQSDGSCTAIGASVASIGFCNSADNKVYFPTWTTVATKITITGLVEAK